MTKKDKHLSKDRQQHRRDLVIIGVITLVVLATGAFFYHSVEKMSIIDAIYFSVITLTTVGYGDLTPQTDIGKLFTIGYVIIGIGIIATFARVLLQSTFARRLRHEDTTERG